MFAKKERIDAIKNQSYKCGDEDCGREFKLHKQLAKHCLLAHGLTLRMVNQKPVFKSSASFFMNSTPMSRAARVICLNVKKNAKKPFKLINMAQLKSQCKFFVFS